MRAPAARVTVLYKLFAKQTLPLCEASFPAKWRKSQEASSLLTDLPCAMHFQGPEAGKHAAANTVMLLFRGWQQRGNVSDFQILMSLRE
jgi:hypothetical protein